MDDKRTTPTGEVGAEGLLSKRDDPSIARETVFNIPCWCASLRRGCSCTGLRTTAEIPPLDAYRLDPEALGLEVAS